MAVACPLQLPTSSPLVRRVPARRPAAPLPAPNPGARPHLKLLLCHQHRTCDQRNAQLEGSRWRRSVRDVFGCSMPCGSCAPAVPAGLWRPFSWSSVPNDDYRSDDYSVSGLLPQFLSLLRPSRPSVHEFDAALLRDFES